MNKVFSLIFAFPLFVISHSTVAETFSERLEVAKALEKTEEFPIYEKALFDAVGNQLANTMRNCFQNIENPNDNSFVMVSGITKEGRAVNVDVEPKTNISLCFINGFKMARFPTPPPYGGKPYPFYIDMTITE